MRIAIVSPEPVPAVRGGAERAWDGLEAAIGRLTDHRVEQVKLPVDERALPGLVDGYRRFAALDLDRFDVVITSKYPAWMVDHPDHRLLMFHPLRGLYDTYHLFDLPPVVAEAGYAVGRVLEVVRSAPDAARLPELLRRFDRLVDAVGADHPDLALPGPLARELVHWLDRVALDPSRIRAHQALSRRVASRPGYFPDGVVPEVVLLPSDLPRPGPPAGGDGSSATGTAGRSFFTCSRLDHPKRIDLLVAAAALAGPGCPLVIAGTGPAEPELRRLADGLDHVSFLGRIDDAELVRRYQEALATLFVPLDEDLGLVTLESHGCATPVVTTLDAGGPTELVVHGLDGLVVAPTPASLASACSRLAADPDWAASMGRAGYRRSGAVTWERAVARILALRPPPAAPGADGPRGAGAGTGPAGASAGAGGPAGSSSAAGTAGSGRRLRVTTMSTYGVYPPRGGGQLRYLHLYGAAARRVEVEILTLVAPPFATTSTEIGPGLVETAVAASLEHHAVDQDLSGRLAVPTTDIVAGRDVELSPDYLDALAASVEKSDVVLLSHPFLLPALDAIGADRPIVFDAHNVETDLKRAVLPDTAEARGLVDFVDRVERRATAEAATVVTCSIEDAEVLAARAGRPASDGFVVIPNGTDVATTVPSPEHRTAAGRRWRDRWRALAHPAVAPSAVAVFVASWHPPNLDAAQALIDLAPELPDVVVLLVGSHSRYFQGRTLPPNVVLAGVVSDTAKRTLLASVDVALNPMRTGSGTNLKIVEYFAAGIPVVSTPFGARGLDAGDEHLVLAEIDGFGAAVRGVLADPAAAHRRAAAARRLVVARYGWDRLGDRLADLLEAAAQPSSARSARR